MVAYTVFAVRGRFVFKRTFVFMNQVGQTNYEIGVLFKPLLSIGMMRCRFLMFQHILRIPGNSCIYSICRNDTCNDHKITLVFDTSEYIVLEK